jgi:ubiquitin-conjugating enzyme E2 variant
MHTKLASQAPSGLPRHDEISVVRRIWEAACITTAAGLLVVNIARLTNAQAASSWWLLAAAAAGCVGADLASGFVHWLADTWGSETMPLLGRRFVRPFRVHHVNPDDFLRRSFLDTNGDVAMLVVPILTAGLLLPFDVAWGQTISAFVTAFAAVALPTNQVHQWAHMREPPRLVRWLQDHRIILSRGDHARHHRAPYAINYCISTGWCNWLMTRGEFFRYFERAVTFFTSLSPRHDDARFQTDVETAMEKRFPLEGDSRDR